MYYLLSIEGIPLLTRFKTPELLEAPINLTPIKY